MSDNKEDTGAHYRYGHTVALTQADIERGLVDVKLDPYRIARIYDLGGGPREHIVKKALRGTGKGGSEQQLINELRDALDRWEEMLGEDADVRSRRDDEVSSVDVPTVGTTTSPQAQASTEQGTTIVPPVPKAHQREWRICKRCGHVAYADFLPMSLAVPIVTTPCGHDWKRDYREISQHKALQMLGIYPEESSDE